MPSELYAQPATAFVAEFVGTTVRIPGGYDGQSEVSVLGTVAPVTVLGDSVQVGLAAGEPVLAAERR